MKKINLIISLLLAVMAINVSAQETTYQLTTEEEMHEYMQAVGLESDKKFHYTVDFCYSPFSLWNFELLQNDVSVLNVKTHHSIYVDFSVDYQLPQDFYVGAGVGFKVVEFHKTQEGQASITNCYTLPIYAKAGGRFAMSNAFDFNIEVQVGGNIGFENAKSSLYFGADVAVIYKKHFKLGVALCNTLVDIKQMTGVDFNGDYDLTLGPVVGIIF